MTTLRVKISAIPGTALAENKGDARRIRTESILPALRKGDRVEIDFSEVGFATQSFVHALVSEAIRTYRESIFEKLSFVNCTAEVQQIVLTVFEYTLDAPDAADGLPSCK